MRIKKLDGILYLLSDRLPKEGDKFFEIGSRTSYHDRIFECKGRTQNFVFSGDYYKNTDIYHPWPENCKPIIFKIKIPWYN